MTATTTTHDHPDGDQPRELRIVEGITDPIGVRLLATPLDGPRARIMVALEQMLQTPALRRELSTAWKEEHWDRVERWHRN